MKTRRIASSLALAAAIALGTTGCGLFAPQGTTELYAPSDGIDVDLQGADIRNLLLIADESGDNFNVVFTGVNQTESPVLVRITFVAENGSTEASADFEIEPGTTIFGDPEGDVPPTLVSIPKLIPGATVDAFFEVAGGGEVNRAVPVLDGTLAEYKSFVLSPSQLRALEEEPEGDADGVAGNETDASSGEEEPSTEG